MTRKALVLVATATLALGGVLGAGGAAAATPGATAAPRDTVYCTYTTNAATPVHSSPSAGGVLYTVPKGKNVLARQTNTGNYKYGSYTSHISGYMYATHLYNQRACLE